MPTECPSCQHRLPADHQGPCPACGAQPPASGDEDDFSWLDSCLTEPIDSSILDDGGPRSLPSTSSPESHGFESSLAHDFDSRFGGHLKPAPEMVPPRASAITVDDALSRRVPGWLKSLGFGLLALLLLIALALQLLWFNREQAVESPLGRQLLNALCHPLGCQPPQRRDLERLRILLNDVKPTERPAKSLLITLTLGNTADFDQPFPRIDVTLLDTEERVVGKRRFAPQDYLLPGSDPKRLFRAHSIADASILLADPGPRVTGYRFDLY